MVTENLARIRIRSPDHPARSQSLYRLSYPGPPMEWILLEKLTGPQPVKKFPTFYGTWKYATAFTTACQPPLSWTGPMQPTTFHPTTWSSVLILSSYLQLDLTSGIFSSIFPSKLCIYLSCLPHVPHALSISFFVIWPHEFHLVRGTDQKSPEKWTCKKNL